MQITFRTGTYQLSPDDRVSVEEKLVAPLRLLGQNETGVDGNEDGKILDIEISNAPAEGRSATPCRLVAKLTVNGRIYHAEAVKPTAASAADRARRTLEAEIRKSHGRARRMWRIGSAAFKRIARFGR